MCGSAVHSTEAILRPIRDREPMCAFVIDREDRRSIVPVGFRIA